MKPLIDPINTSDGKFHGKDKQTGDLATIVTPEYMNDNQDAARSMQREILSILAAADINPEEATDNQLLTALKKVLITADDERVKNALQKESNLSDVSDKAKSLANLGGYPSTGGVLTNDGAVITLKAKTADSSVYLIMDDSDGSNLCYVGKGSNGNNDAVFNNYKGGNNSIILRANGSVDLTAQQSQPINLNAEPRTTSPSAWRIVYGDYGAFWHQDGANLYLLLTNKGDPRGNYNALRPLTVNVATGAVSIGTPLTVNNEITSSYNETFAWVDQYKTKAPFYNAYSTTGASEYHPVLKQQATITGKNSWAFSMGSLVASDALSWHLHMKGSGGQDINFTWDTSGNFTAPGEVNPGNYANFDARYQLKSACPFPVGAILTMGNGTNPATIYAGTTWKDLSASYSGRVMQIGATALATGGSNSVTLTADNLPDHKHKAGDHAPGGSWNTNVTRGTDNQKATALGYTSETLTTANVAVKHTPVNVQNAFVSVKAWMRTA